MESNDFSNVLEDGYNIKVTEIEKSSESTEGNVYIISDINQSKYVIKVYNDIEHAGSMVKLHTYINNIGLKAPIIIKNNQEKQTTEHEDKYIVCYSFINGVKLKETDLTNKRIEDVANYLRALHNITENIFSLNEVPYKVQTSRESVLHFDITKQNIFINNSNQEENKDDNKDEEIYFIDFDDAKYGPSVCDVAIAATNLFINKANGLDREGMSLFIDKYYQDDIDLKEKELPLIKEAATAWLKSIINNPSFDTSTRAGLENKLKIWNDITLYV